MSKQETFPTYKKVLPHPTPIHIRSCIYQELIDDVETGLDPIPYRVLGIIRRGIAKACAEHDAGVM